MGPFNQKNITRGKSVNALAIQRNKSPPIVRMLQCRLPASRLEGRPRSCRCEEKKPHGGLSLGIISPRSSVGGSAATRARSQHKDRKSYTLPLCYGGRAPLRPLHPHFLLSDVCSRYMRADVYMSRGSQLKASPWLGST